MEDMALLIDFHRDAQRQGPGSVEATQRALATTGLDSSHPLTIADIGCGTGAASLVLANQFPGHITAVDLLPEFLETLEARAHAAGVSDRIQPIHASMNSLPFEGESLDLLWSEGAIYNMGFEAGIADWFRFLKPGGFLVVSEITWFSTSRPPELGSHWESAYPEIDTASSKMDALERHGYRPQAYFALPESCWLAHYYAPMEARFDAFLARHGHSEAAQALVAGEQTEIALYKTYRDYFGYGVYIARKPVSS